MKYEYTFNVFSFTIEKGKLREFDYEISIFDDANILHESKILTYVFDTDVVIGSISSAEEFQKTVMTKEGASKFEDTSIYLQAFAKINRKVYKCNFSKSTVIK